MLAPDRMRLQPPTDPRHQTYHKCLTGLLGVRRGMGGGVGVLNYSILTRSYHRFSVLWYFPRVLGKSCK